MPIQSYQILKRIAKLSHAKIPGAILDRIEKVKSDDEAVKKVGVDILSELVEQMKTLPQPAGVPRGFHFYTLNLEKSVAFILERTGLIPSLTSEGNPEGRGADSASDSDVAVDDERRDVRALVPNGTNGIQSGISPFSKRRKSSVNAQPHNRVIIDSPNRSSTRRERPDADADPPGPSTDVSLATKHSARDRGTGIPASSPTRRQKLLISEGQGSLGRESSWDDYPNGRWGPSQSPAFGEIDGLRPKSEGLSAYCEKVVWAIQSRLKTLLKYSDAMCWGSWLPYRGVMTSTQTSPHLTVWPRTETRQDHYVPKQMSSDRNCSL